MTFAHLHHRVVARGDSMKTRQRDQNRYRQALIEGLDLGQSVEVDADDEGVLKSWRNFCYRFGAANEMSYGVHQRDGKVFVVRWS